jgi:hypothetical protein
LRFFSDFSLPSSKKKRLSCPRRFRKIVFYAGRLTSTTLAAVATSAAATAPIATAAATISTTSAAAAVAATSTAATTTRSCFTRSCFIYSQGTAFDGLAVEVGDRFLRVGFTAHRDKGKPARFPGKFVLHEGDFLDRASLGEKVLQVGFGGIEGKISYV